MTSRNGAWAGAAGAGGVGVAVWANEIRTTGTLGGGASHSDSELAGGSTGSAEAGVLAITGGGGGSICTGGRLTSGTISIISPQPAHLPTRPIDVGLVNSFIPQWPQMTAMAPGGTFSDIGPSIGTESLRGYFHLKPWFTPRSVGKTPRPFC
jgi:hypothetical protein